MSKHTQGKWVATGNGIHVKTRCVATTHMEPKEQRDIDARLIAAAPDLLEALREMVACDAEAIEDAERIGIPFPDEMLATYNKACAAIAKATGERP